MIFLRINIYYYIILLGGGVNRTADSQFSKNSTRNLSPKWQVGELEWEAWMRVLDSAVIIYKNLEICF